MLYTEDYSMRHYVGFSQIGSHISTHTHIHIPLFTVTVTVSLDPPLVQVYIPESDELTELIVIM